VRVRETDGIGEIREVCALMGAVWGESLLDPALARAIQHAGGYVVGAWDGERLVGGSVAFLGRGDDEVVLHSHATWAAPAAQGRGIGPAIKWHQRQWALDRGIGAIEWTYDPLVTRNGWFNLTKLGARAVAYEIDFYGRMDTAIERGEESDRCLVRWDLDDPRVVAAAAGTLDPADPDALRAGGATILLEVAPGGGPVIGDRPGAGIALAHLHPDIERLRVDDPATAREWRRALRETVGAAMQAGHQLTGASRDGWYVLG
jgi:predicted GNAT superfamily acetyltransferase